MDGIDEIDIKGNLSLDVTGYNYNGATYTDIKSLVKAIYASGTTDDVFYVDFTVNGETAPRTARIRANSYANPDDDLTIDYQYKLSYTVQNSAAAGPSPQEISFYRRDGAIINLPVLADDNYVTQDGIEYHNNKWNVQGQNVSGGNVRVNASGNAAIGNITPVVDTTYGFDSSAGLVVNQNSGTVVVNNAGKSSVQYITLPSSGSVALDFSSVSGLSLGIDSSGGSIPNAIANKERLASVTFPTSSFKIGENVFQNCTIFNGPLNLANCTDVRDFAFDNCTGITSLNLSSCTSIGESAFSGCTNLRTVTLGPDIAWIDVNNFDSLPNLIVYFSKDPTTVTYGGYLTFAEGATAIYNGTTYRWSQSSPYGWY